MDTQELNAGSNDVVFCHPNVRSILPKIEECRSFVQQARQQLVFGVSKTWLDETVNDDELQLSNHMIFRRDRKSRGGGVMVYVPDALRCWRRIDLESEDVEAVWS